MYSQGLPLLLGLLLGPWDWGKLDLTRLPEKWDISLAAVPTRKRWTEFGRTLANWCSGHLESLDFSFLQIPSGGITKLSQLLASFSLYIWVSCPGILELLLKIFPSSPTLLLLAFWFLLARDFM